MSCLKMYLMLLLAALPLLKEVGATSRDTRPALNFTVPSKTFMINQTYRSGDIITNKITCVALNVNVVAVRYQLTSDNFRINPVSGELTIDRNALNLPCYNCNFSLTISCEAIYKVNSQRHDKELVEITVIYQLVNKHRPAFTQSSLNVSLLKSLDQTTHLITTFEATDPDFGICSFIEYSISSGNEDGYFQLNASTGVLVLMSTPDSETPSEFSLTVRATNTMCSPHLSSTIAVYIKLLERLSATVPVEDLLPVGTVIASSRIDSNALVLINASDQITNQGPFQFSFALSSDFLTEYFVLNSDIGELTLNKSLKYKYCLEQNFPEQIKVSIRICAEGVVTDCSVFDVMLNVIVSSDCSTTFDESMYRIQVNESVPVGIELYHTICRSPGGLETIENKKFSVIHGQDPEMLNFLGSTLVLNKSLDYESETEHSFVIQCTDLILEQMVIAPVTIRVLPSNEYHPKFTHPFYTYTLDSTHLQLPVVIGQVQALDNDSGEGGELVYRLDDSTDSQFLEVDNNGSLSLIRKLDSQICDKLVIMMEVSDGMFTDRATVLISRPVARPVAMRSESCDEFCIAFAVTLLLLVLSLIAHIATFLTFCVCWKKKQRESVEKFQRSILETSRRNSRRQSASGNPFCCSDTTETVPCPMYTTIPTAANGRRHKTELPPIPAQAYERPVRKSSGTGDYLEMSSVIRKKSRSNSDPALSERYDKDEVERRLVPLLSEGGREKKLSLLGGGEMITPERRSVDNIYDFITT